MTLVFWIMVVALHAAAPTLDWYCPSWPLLPTALVKDRICQFDIKPRNVPVGLGDWLWTWNDKGLTGSRFYLFLNSDNHDRMHHILSNFSPILRRSTWEDKHKMSDQETVTSDRKFSIQAVKSLKSDRNRYKVGPFCSCNFWNISIEMTKVH